MLPADSFRICRVVKLPCRADSINVPQMQAGINGAEVSCQYQGDPADPLLVMSIPPICNSALSSTPFGGKLEVILRLAGLPYEAVPGDPSDQKATPKGKVRNAISEQKHRQHLQRDCPNGLKLEALQFPVLRHGDLVVPDSSTIFDYLKSTYPKEMSVLSPPDAQACVYLPGSSIRMFSSICGHACTMLAGCPCGPTLPGNQPAPPRMSAVPIIQHNKLKLVRAESQAAPARSLHLSPSPRCSSATSPSTWPC